MKLNIMVIYEALSRNYTLCFVTCVDTNFAYSRPRLDTPGASLVENEIYVARSSDLPPLSENQSPSNICIVAIGKPPAEYTKLSLNIIWIETVQHISSVFNELQEVYNIYDNYESSLNQGLLEQLGFQTVITVFENIFRNPVAIVDMNFHYLAKSPELGNTPETAELMADKDGNMPLDVVNSVKFDPIFNAVSEYKEAFLYVNDITTSHNLCLNIWHRESQVARVLIFEVNTPFLEGHYYLMNALRPYVHLYYEQFIFSNVSQPLSLRHTLMQILDGHQVSSYILEQTLKNHGWEMEDTFVLYYVQLSEDDRRSKTSAFICKNLMTEFSFCTAFEYKDNIVLLINQTRAGQDIEFVESRLIYIFRESILKTGKSRRFSGLFSISEYYRQAVAALRLGHRFQPTIWHHTFEEYAFLYLLIECKNLASPGTLYADGLLKLREYDRDNHTSYNETLKAYLYHHFNTTHAAASLYIHRTTFIERMGRIKKIINFNLDDYDTCLHLMISYRLEDL